MMKGFATPEGTREVARSHPGMAVEARRLSHAVAEADPDWAAAETLSQRAVCAVRSTAGVTSVLVGMRKNAYVTDVLTGLKLPMAEKSWADSWKRLGDRIS